MAITRRPPPSAGGSQKKPVYVAAFIQKVLVLLHMGHQRLDFSSYASSAEDDITGELVTAVKDVLTDDRSPSWCYRFFCRDEERLNTGNRRGKNRRKVDISFERGGEAWLRPQFQFEAKRLRDGRSVGAYLGGDGLGCFFAGQDAYAREHDDAGMLGYVQAEDETAWASRIGSRLAKEPRKHHVSPDGAWSGMAVADGPSHVYRTRHDRQDPPRPLAVFHVLLRFC